MTFLPIFFFKIIGKKNNETTHETFNMMYGITQEFFKETVINSNDVCHNYDTYLCTYLYVLFIACFSSNFGSLFCSFIPINIHSSRVNNKTRVQLQP